MEHSFSESSSELPPRFKMILVHHLGEGTRNKNPTSSQMSVLVPFHITEWKCQNVSDLHVMGFIHSFTFDYWGETRCFNKCLWNVKSHKKSSVATDLKLRRYTYVIRVILNGIHYSLLVISVAYTLSKSMHIIRTQWVAAFPSCNDFKWFFFIYSTSLLNAGFRYKVKWPHFLPFQTRYRIRILLIYNVLKDS